MQTSGLALEKSKFEHESNKNKFEKEYMYVNNTSAIILVLHNSNVIMAFVFPGKITNMDVGSPREPAVICTLTMSEKMPLTQAGCWRKVGTSELSLNQDQLVNKRISANSS